MPEPSFANANTPLQSRRIKRAGAQAPRQSLCRAQSRCREQRTTLSRKKELGPGSVMINPSVRSLLRTQTCVCLFGFSMRDATAYYSLSMTAYYAARQVNRKWRSVLYSIRIFKDSVVLPILWRLGSPQNVANKCYVKERIFFLDLAGSILIKQSVLMMRQNISLKVASQRISVWGNKLEERRKSCLFVDRLPVSSRVLFVKLYTTSPASLL